VELLLRSRANDLDRLVNARHAALAEAVARRISGLGGWMVRPEVSFNVYGERGVVDLLAWHAATRSLLVIELKTAIIDVGELLGTLDRKVRLGRGIARSLGWEPATVSAWLIVAEGRTNRRRVVEHRAVFASAFPDDGRTMRRWISRPGAPVRAVSFWPIRHAGTIRPGFAAVQRVRSRSPRSGSASLAARPG